MRLRKVLSFVCVGAMLVSLAACGKGNEAGGDSSGKESANSQGDNGSPMSLEDALNPEEEIELDLWCIATEADVCHNAYIKAVEDFEKTYPNVKINMEIFENDSYKTKLKSAAAANELPDIFFSWQGGFSKTFAKSGKLLKLDSFYETYKDELPEAMTTNARYVDDSLYGTSYGINCSLLMYDKTKFEKFGLKAPETWDDFMNACQTFCDNDITPITLSAKEPWTLAVLHDAIALKSAGNEKTISTLTKAGGSYDDKDFLFAAEQIKKLVDMGAFVDGAAGLSYLESKSLFESGDVPMLIQLASECTNTYDLLENQENYDIVPFPVVGENAKHTDMMGGTSETLMVSAETEYPNQAGYAAFELSKRIANVASEDGVITSPWTTTPEKKNLSEFHQKAEDYKLQATSYCLWWDTEMDADDAAEYLSLLEQLFVGDIMPEEFVKGMSAQLSQ